MDIVEMNTDTVLPGKIMICVGGIYANREDIESKIIAYDNTKNWNFPYVSDDGGLFNMYGVSVHADTATSTSFNDYDLVTVIDESGVIHPIVEVGVTYITERNDTVTIKREMDNDEIERNPIGLTHPFVSTVNDYYNVVGFRYNATSGSRLVFSRAASLFNAEDKDDAAFDISQFLQDKTTSEFIIEEQLNIDVPLGDVEHGQYYRNGKGEVILLCGEILTGTLDYLAGYRFIDNKGRYYSGTGQASRLIKSLNLVSKVELDDIDQTTGLAIQSDVEALIAEYEKDSKRWGPFNCERQAVGVISYVVGCIVGVVCTYIVMSRR